MNRGSLDRRQFVRAAAAIASAVTAGVLPALASCGENGPDGGDLRTALPAPAALAAGASLVAAPGTASIAKGETAAVWLYNGGLPGPTVRVRRGEQLQIQHVNGLADPTIVHWHGLLVPEHQDGHPRDAIGPGATYSYNFPIVQRAGTFWYHPHAHRDTARQIQRGMAGFLIVSDAEEDALGLPSGDREILLLLQDRDADPARACEYNPSAADLHSGMLRGTPFGNGVRLPTRNVAGARYRIRILNASHARVYQLALDTNAPLTVIGNDGGLLASAEPCASVFLGVGERIDFVADFSGVPDGMRMMLKSLPFSIDSAPASAYPQGMALDLLELVRVGATGTAAPLLPATLSSITPLGAPAAERTFVFTSTDDAAMHRINGLSFDMDRVDVQVPFGQVERWTFRNESVHPHPVHVHGTHFQVMTRTGGRGTVYPYERGWKDTVLVMPLEAVEVLIQFNAYRGLFLLHCHNLEHEDLGMMLNVEVT